MKYLIPFLLALVTGVVAAPAQSAGFEKIYPITVTDDYSITEIALADDGVGGYLVAASVWLVDLTASTDVAVFRLNAQGDTLWAKTFGTSYPDYVRQIVPLADGNFLLAGARLNDSGNTPTTSGSFIWLLKITPDGEILWEKEINPEWFWGWTSAAFELADGSLMLGGFAYIFWKNTAFLMKLDESGNLKWTQYYDNFLETSLCSIKRNEAGEFFIAGEREDANFNPRFGMIKVGPNGDQMWSRIYTTFPQSGTALFAHLANGPAGSIYLCGTDFDLDKAALVGVIFRLQPSGLQSWRRYLYGSNFTDEIFLTSASTDDGGVLILSEFKRLIKYKPNGDTASILDLKPLLHDSAYVHQLFRGADGYPVLAGEIFPGRLYLRKLGAPLFTGITAPDSTDSRLNLFPNPTTGSFLIQGARELVHGEWQCQLFDTNGRLVDELPYSSEAFSEPWDIRKQPPGVYQVVVQSGSRLLQGKIVKM